MALRTINDVKISPAGDRVAYTVSTPSVARNAHEPALFVIPAAGGTAKRLAESHRIFAPALPAPRLRWLPDGKTLSMLVAEKIGPQVVTIDPDNERRHAVATQRPTASARMNGRRTANYLAYLSRGGGRSWAPRRRLPTRSGPNPPATRLWVQPIASANTGAVD